MSRPVIIEGHDLNLTTVNNFLFPKYSTHITFNVLLANDLKISNVNNYAKLDYIIFYIHLLDI